VADVCHRLDRLLPAPSRRAAGVEVAGVERGPGMVGNGECDAEGDSSGSFEGDAASDLVMHGSAHVQPRADADARVRNGHLPRLLLPFVQEVRLVRQRERGFELEGGGDVVWEHGHGEVGHGVVFDGERAGDGEGAGGVAGDAVEGEAVDGVGAHGDFDSVVEEAGS